MMGTEADQRRTRRRPTIARRQRSPVCVALLIIDDGRLRAAAWAEFHTARKRMEKANRQLHQHEELDVPTYQQWLYQTFPALVTRLRELEEAVSSTARKIHAVQAEAFYFGGSPRNIWRDHRERADDPATFAPGDDDAEAEDGPEFEAHPEDFEHPPKLTPSEDARAIYRRLVQRLHPDRGGEWTPVRERLWHEVQLAWAAGDADWLARLEVDWEASHDVLGPHSPLSRLRRAIAETDAARRDTERKLRAYRKHPAWRFTRTKKTRPTLQRRIERELHEQFEILERQLAHLHRTIASWEEDWTRVRRGHRRRGTHA